MKPTSTRGRAIPVLLAALILVGGANVAAYAATGGSFLLGKSNTASRVTLLSRTRTGPVLSLHAKSSGSAPLTTNARGRVANLNADELDGLDSTSLQNRPYVFGFPAANDVTDVAFTFAAVPPGRYLVTYALSVTNSGIGHTDECWFAPKDGVGAQLLGNGATFLGSFETINAAGYVDTRSYPKFRCTVDAGTFSLDTGVSQITFTRLDGANPGTAAASSRVGGR